MLLDLLRLTAMHQRTWGIITAIIRMATTWQIMGPLARRKSNTKIITPRQNHDHALVQDLPLVRSEIRAIAVGPIDHRRHGLLPIVPEWEEAPTTPTTTILATIIPTMLRTAILGIPQT